MEDIDKWVVQIKKQKWTYDDYADARRKTKELLDCDACFITFKRLKEKKVKKAKKEVKK